MKTVTIQPQEGPQTAFLASDADIVIYGGGAGGGKSWALLLEDLYYADDPAFASVTFRRTYPQIVAPGGLWEDSMTLYGHLGAKPSVDPLQWRWKSGAISRFAHMQYEGDKFQWQGSQIPLIKWDELTHFSRSQFFYLLSRNRSAAGIPTRMRASCNADADSWVAELIAWWINQQTGHPIPERAGVIRYFARDGERMIWADDPLDLPRIVVDGVIVPPKSLTFIPATVYDNKVLLKADPGYLATLMSLDYVERERLLGNNWKIRYTAGSMFKEEWFADKYVKRDDPRLKQLDGQPYRFWDTAATPVTDTMGNVVAFENPPKNKPNDPDWTVGVKMGKKTTTEVYEEDGVTKKRQRVDYFILDVVRYRGTPSGVEDTIRATAQRDGRGVKIGIEQEPGASGVAYIATMKKVLRGFMVEADRPTGSKIVRAKSFSADAEHGHIWLVEGPWNEPYIQTVTAFPNPKVHDDDVDASSGCHDRLKNRKANPVSY